MTIFTGLPNKTAKTGALFLWVAVLACVALYFAASNILFFFLCFLVFVGVTFYFGGMIKGSRRMKKDYNRKMDDLAYQRVKHEL